MSTGLIVLWVVVGIVVILAGYIVIAYNRLVGLRVNSEEAYSDIDVQSKRRYDLIPNLVEAVKGYAAHEKEVFENVTKARTAAMSATGFEEKAKAENMLSATLKSLFAVAEAYPQLKANENFLQLQGELVDTEDKMMAARRNYNMNVRDLNVAIQQFPSNIIAGMFSFKKKDMFEVAEEAEKEAVKVKF